MKNNVLASAMLVALGMGPTTAVANTAGLTGIWTGTYSFDITTSENQVIPDDPGIEAWTWDFDAGTILIANSATFLGSTWTAHDVTFSDLGTSYGSAGAVNLLYDWSVNLDIPVISDWDVTATGNAVSDAAVVTVNTAIFTADSILLPGFHPEFSGTLHKVSGAQVVPIPATAWLMGSGLISLVSLARRRRK